MSDDDRSLPISIPNDIDAKIEGSKLIVDGKEYSITEIRKVLDEKSKEEAPWTMRLGQGALFAGGAFGGPVGGIAGATLGSSLGYLLDEGYISLGEDEDVQEIEPERVEEGEIIDSEADSKGTKGASSHELPELFQQHEEKWYRPDSDIYVLTIKTSDGERVYFETIDGAEERLRAEVNEETDE